MSDELKPCPFCGASGDQLQMVVIGGVGQLKSICRVQCLECGCEGKHCHARDEAAEYWNTRTDRLAALRPRIEALLERGDEYQDQRTTVEWRQKVCSLLRELLDASA